MIEYAKGFSLKCAENWEKHIFHIYFLNIDISLIMKITGMTIAIQVAESPIERDGCLRMLIQALDFVFFPMQNIEL